jgi:hypothetical protein
MAMSYARSRMLCAAARLGVADALADEVRSADDLAKTRQADVDALYRQLRALAGGTAARTSGALNRWSQSLAKAHPQKAARAASSLEHQQPATEAMKFTSRPQMTALHSRLYSKRIVMPPNCLMRKAGKVSSYPSEAS